MKIDFISDVHCDHWCKELNPQSPKLQRQIKNLINILQPNHHDVLIIAGDLGHYYSQDTLFLLKMKEYYKHIIIVQGNHDMYLVSKSLQKKYKMESWNRVLEMKEFCRENGIHHLDGNSVEIDGITFAGAGMSWDGSHRTVVDKDCSIGELIEHWKHTMNDSKLIFSGGQDNYTIPLAYGGIHKVSSFDPLEYFDSQKEKLHSVDKADVIISHYPPKVPDDISDRFKYDLTTSFYYFNGDEFFDKYNPKFWVCGHTHRDVNEMYKGCNILCNALGYPDEISYGKIKTFEIKE